MFQDLVFLESKEKGLYQKDKIYQIRNGMTGISKVEKIDSEEGHTAMSNSNVLEE